MTWWQYLRSHAQRPANLTAYFTPTYWRQCSRERASTLHTRTERVPCGHATTTQYIAPTGAVLRQDTHITVGRHALPKV